jgi:hypothetical protein
MRIKETISFDLDKVTPDLSCSLSFSPSLRIPLPCCVSVWGREGRLLLKSCSCDT